MDDIPNRQLDHLARRLEQLRTCTRCRKTDRADTFPTCRSRNHVEIRNICHDCLKAYYREYYRKRRTA